VTRRGAVQACRILPWPSRRSRVPDSHRRRLGKATTTTTTMATRLIAARNWKRKIPRSVPSPVRWRKRSREKSPGTRDGSHRIPFLPNLGDLEGATKGLRDKAGALYLNEWSRKDRRRRSPEAKLVYPKAEDQSRSEDTSKDRFAFKSAVVIPTSPWRSYVAYIGFRASRINPIPAGVAFLRTCPVPTKFHCYAAPS